MSERQSQSVRVTGSESQGQSVRVSERQSVRTSECQSVRAFPWAMPLCEIRRWVGGDGSHPVRALWREGSAALGPAVWGLLPAPAVPSLHGAVLKHSETQRSALAVSRTTNGHFADT